jgi:hypothetical protein
MARSLPSSVLALVALASLAGTAMPAAAAANQYRAELAAPAAPQRVIVRDVVWSCAGDSCVAQQTTSRPATDCSALAGHVGALKSFSVAGQALAADALEKCNARAR